MNQIQITLHVSAGKAIRDGSTQCGEARLDVTPEVLATLNETQRDTLARHLLGEHLYRVRLDHSLPKRAFDKEGDLYLIGRADAKTLAQLLDWRREEIDARAEATRADLLERLRLGCEDQREVRTNPSGAKFVFLQPKKPKDDYGSPHLPDGWEKSGDPELVEAGRAFLAAEERREAANAVAQQARDAEDARHREDQAAKSQARCEAIKARAEELEAQLDMTLCARWRAKYATEEEVETALWNVVLAELGLANWEHFDSDAAEVLTDEEYARFAEWQSQHPDLESWAVKEEDEEHPLYVGVRLNEPAIRYLLSGYHVESWSREFLSPLS